MSTSDWIAFGALLLTVGGATLAAFVAVIGRVGSLEAKMEIIWRDLSFAATVAAAKLLHRCDDAHALDALIEAFMDESITSSQLETFVERLDRVVASSHAPRLERKAAQVMIDAVKERYMLLSEESQSEESQSEESQ